MNSLAISGSSLFIFSRFIMLLKHISHSTRVEALKERVIRKIRIKIMNTSQLNKKKMKKLSYNKKEFFWMQI
jgi:hypothetical protein